MKRLTLLLLMVSMTVLSFAQQEFIERGDKLYDKFNFNEALQFYQDAFNEDTTSLYAAEQAGLCMRKLGMIKESGEWFLKTIELKSPKPENKLYYAESLKANGEYKKAVFWYARYSAERPDDRRAQKHIRDTQYFRDLWADSLKYEIKSLLINSDKPSFGMCRFNDRYVFCSAGVRSFSLEEAAFDEVPFLDVYSCDLDDRGEAIDAKRLNGNVNSKYHDGPAFFDGNYQTMYVTRNNMRGGRPVYDKSGTANLQIYAIRLENGIWKKEEPMEFNSDEFSTGHPTVDIISSRMVFVSNMPGGYGGTDLYETRYTKNGWTTPENLGPEVNTEGNEMFPFISDEGILYFSSDGHAGLGGLDIFMISTEEMDFAEPVNLGFPINSSHDDFGIHYNETDDIGYFSSNRKGTDKIFRFRTRQFMQQVVAMHFTSEDELLAGKYVTIRSLKQPKDEVYRLDENGSVEAVLDAGEEFQVFMGEGESMSSEPIAEFGTEDELSDTFVDLGAIQVERESLVQAGIIDQALELEAALKDGDEMNSDEHESEIRDMLTRLRDEKKSLSDKEYDDLTSSELVDYNELDKLVADQNKTPNLNQKDNPLSCDAANGSMKDAYVNLGAMQLSYETLCDEGLLERALELSDELQATNGNISPELEQKRQKLLSDLGAENLAEALVNLETILPEYKVLEEAGLLEEALTIAYSLEKEDPLMAEALHAQKSALIDKLTAEQMNAATINLGIVQMDREALMEAGVLEEAVELSLAINANAGNLSQELKQKRADLIAKIGDEHMKDALINMGTVLVKYDAAAKRGVLKESMALAEELEGNSGADAFALEDEKLDILMALNGGDDPASMTADDDSLLLSCEEEPGTVKLEGTYVNLDAIQISQEVLCDAGLLEDALLLSEEILSSKGVITPDMAERRQAILDGLDESDRAEILVNLGTSVPEYVSLKEEAVLQEALALAYLVEKDDDRLNGEIEAQRQVLLSRVSEEQLHTAMINFGMIELKREALVQAGLLEEALALSAAISESPEPITGSLKQRRKEFLDKLDERTLDGALINMGSILVRYDALNETNQLPEAIALAEAFSDDSPVDMMQLTQQKMDILAQFSGEEAEVIQRVTYLQLKNEELRSYALNNIYFGFDSYDIRNSQRSKITALLEMLREDDSIELIIKAHADSRGDDDYNLLLSMRRAKTIEKALVSKGIPQDRFQIAWVGEREPFIDCYNQRCTEEEHALNRRVELIFIDSSENRVASE